MLGVILLPMQFVKV